jgi:hypothetical protein
MTRQTPEKFAKMVLWQLAGIRAEQQQLRMYLLHKLAEETGLQQADAIRTWEGIHDELRLQIYHESLKATDIGGPDDVPPGEKPRPKRKRQ